MRSVTEPPAARGVNRKSEPSLHAVPIRCPYLHVRLPLPRVPGSRGAAGLDVPAHGHAGGFEKPVRLPISRHSVNCRRDQAFSVVDRSCAIRYWQAINRGCRRAVCDPGYRTTSSTYRSNVLPSCFPAWNYAFSDTFAQRSMIPSP